MFLSFVFSSSLAPSFLYRAKLLILNFWQTRHATYIRKTSCTFALKYLEGGERVLYSIKKPPSSFVSKFTTTEMVKKYYLQFFHYFSYEMYFVFCQTDNVASTVNGFFDVTTVSIGNVQFYLKTMTSLGVQHCGTNYVVH